MWVGVTKWHSGDACELASTLCKYDLRNHDLLFRVGKRCNE